MTRRLLIAVCLLAVPLAAAAPSADAAKRKVPRGFFGTIYDGDLRGGEPDPRGRRVRAHVQLGRRVGPHQLLLG